LRKVFTPFCPRIVSAPEYVPFHPRTSHFSAVEARSCPSRDSLDSLKSVKNVRDLAEACEKIKPGLVFRSACPVAATPDDVDILHRGLKIQNLVDLRSDYERQQDTPLRDGLLSTATVMRGVRKGGGITMQIEELPKGEADPDLKECRVNLLSFLERDRYYKAMLGRLPYRTSAQLLFWGVCNQSYAKVLAIREINKAGLPGLYETILETAGPEIKRALEVIIESAEAEQPVLFFCKVGKDRTGILAACILACCDASKNEIISDYARSDGVDEVALGGMEKDKELQELDTAMFSRAPPEAMEQTLEYFEAVYGGIRAYLEGIGFTRAQQDQLARSVSL